MATSEFDHQLRSVLEGICPRCQVRLAPCGGCGCCFEGSPRWTAEGVDLTCRDLPGQEPALEQGWKDPCGYGRCPQCGTGWAAEVTDEEEIVLERGPVMTRVYPLSGKEKGRLRG
jgi:hypothetical protein